MSSNSELSQAFDAAIGQVGKCKRDNMKALAGESAEPYLQKLEEELRAERERAVLRGTVDRNWFQTTVRGLVEWVPENDLSLIAALGRIVRAAPPSDLEGPS